MSLKCLMCFLKLVFKRRTGVPESFDYDQHFYYFSWHYTPDLTFLLNSKLTLEIFIKKEYNIYILNTLL